MAPGALPDLSTPFALSDEAPRSYRRDGHVTLPGLASPGEIAAYRPALLDAAASAPQVPHKPLGERDTYGRAFLQMFSVWRQNEAAKAFVFSRRFARVAAELMGVSGVRFYHDQALFKEPGGGITPWHQDQFYWPLDTDHTITLWMPLVPITPEMGPMQFASGSQELGHLGDFAIGDESQTRLGQVIEERRMRCTPVGTLAAGDATFHSGWTLHSAPPNETSTMREAMTIIYFADGTRVGPLDHANRRFDRDVWLPGCEPGEPAAGPFNPVLFSK